MQQACKPGGSKPELSYHRTRGWVGGLCFLLYCETAALPLPSFLTRFRVMAAWGPLSWARQSQLAASIMLASLPDSFWQRTRVNNMRVFHPLTSVVKGNFQRTCWLFWLWLPHNHLPLSEVFKCDHDRCSERLSSHLYSASLQLVHVLFAWK